MMISTTPTSDPVNAVIKRLQSAMWWDQCTRTKYSFVTQSIPGETGQVYIRTKNALYSGTFQIYHQASDNAVRIILHTDGGLEGQFTLRAQVDQIELIPRQKGPILTLKSVGPLVIGSMGHLQYCA